MITGFVSHRIVERPPSVDEKVQTVFSEMTEKYRELYCNDKVSSCLDHLQMRKSF